MGIPYSQVILRYFKVAPGYEGIGVAGVASQLIYLHWSFFPQIPNATIVAEVAVATLYEALLNMLYRGEVPGREVEAVMSLPGRIFVYVHVAYITFLCLIPLITPYGVTQP